MRHHITFAAAFATALSACAGASSASIQGSGPTAAQAAEPDEAMRDLLDYVRGQDTTGFLVIRHGKTLVERNWPAPADARLLSVFTYGTNADGALLEDVASQQKSFVSVLIAIAVDKGLIDVARPVNDYLGAGWSKAPPEAEAKIAVIDLLTMSSGLTESFAYDAPAGRRFFYNTPVYAALKPVLEKATGKPLADLTRAWMTEPLGMSDTEWRQRPAALSDVGNPTGLVTTPRDMAKLGQMVLDEGLASDGRRVVSEASLAAMLRPSRANPAYGRLWWLNGSAFTVGAMGARSEGELVATAPDDLVAALGFLDRRLYVVPSLDCVVVRTGAAASDDEFDQHLWERLMRVMG